MPRFGDAAIPIPPDETGVRCLVGSREGFRRHTLAPYDNRVCNFLHELSRVLLKFPELRNFPDIVAFAFWCRKSNIQTLAGAFAAANRMTRRGLGVVLHIAPSNVPVNFAYSYVMGLLAGNANIVRVSSRDFAQVELICRAISGLLDDDRHALVREMTLIVRSPHDDAVNRDLSAVCDGRVIWGGDGTVRYFQSLPVPVRTVDIVFADRYSLCLLDAEQVGNCDSGVFDALVEGFYNDSYQMDQNACSSPHLVLWLGDNEIIHKAAKRFWSGLASFAARKYELHAVAAMNKLTRAHSDAIEMKPPPIYDRYGNVLYVSTLTVLPDTIDMLRGQSGYFYQYGIGALSELPELLTPKCQTLTYFGVESGDFVGLVTEYEFRGLDRIVPVGKALDISVLWDGYDLIGGLSRVLEIA